MKREEVTTVTRDPRAIVHASLLAPSPIQRYRQESGRWMIQGEIGLVATGGWGPDANVVLALGPAPAERVFALADAFFAGAGGYSVVVEVETARPVEDALRAAGWRLSEEEPALVLPRLPAAPPPAPPGLEICQVTDEAGLADFRAVSETSFFLPSLAAALDPDIALFVGYVVGRAVASSRLVRLGDIAEITSVVTMPEWRRRGFGAALTWAAIAVGVARGCTAATLTATELGYPVYRRMGFLPVSTYRTYSPPDPPAG